MEGTSTWSGGATTTRGRSPLTEVWIRGWTGSSTPPAVASETCRRTCRPFLWTESIPFPGDVLQDTRPQLLPSSTRTFVDVTSILSPYHRRPSSPLATGRLLCHIHFRVSTQCPPDRDDLKPRSRVPIDPISGSETCGPAHHTRKRGLQCVSVPQVSHTRPTELSNISGPTTSSLPFPPDVKGAEVEVSVDEDTY